MLLGYRKLLSLLLFIMVFPSSATGRQDGDPTASIAVDYGLLEKKSINASILDLTEFPGETVNISEHQISWSVNDVVLKGQGPTLTFGRYYRSAELRRLSLGNVFAERDFSYLWGLNIPRITVGDVRGHFKNVLAGCNGKRNHGINVSIEGVTGFREVAQYTDISYPENTHTLFENNWILVCESFMTNSSSLDVEDNEIDKTIDDGFTLISPENTRYNFSFYSEESIDGAYRVEGAIHNAIEYYVSDIIDKHGNKLTFDYKQVIHVEDNAITGLPESDLKSRLIKISASDGRELNVNWKNDRITSVAYNGKTISYQYESKGNHNNLKKVVLPENLYWEYEYTNVGDIGGYFNDNPVITGVFLNKITTPYGAEIEYDYEVHPDVSYQNTHSLGQPVASSGYNSPADCNLTSQTLPFGITKRTVTNNGIKNEYTYNFGLYETIVGGELREGELTGVRSATHIIAPDYIKEIAFKCDSKLGHRSVRERVFNNASPYPLLQKKLSKWGAITPIATGTFHTDNNRIKNPSFLLGLKEESISVAGSVYTTTYSNFNKFGKPTIKTETNSANNKKRYTKSGYKHDLSYWDINLPTTAEVSNDGITYIKNKEVTYHDSTTADGKYADLNLPYEQKKIGIWTSRFSEYHADGSLKKVEYNTPLSVGDENRYYTFTDYYRGIPKIVTSAKRHTEAVMTLTREVNIDGLITSVNDFNGQITYYTYDAAERLKSIDLPEDRIYSRSWDDIVYSWSTDSSGNPQRITQYCLINKTKDGCEEDKLKITETFDNALRKISIKTEDSANGIIQYQNFNYNSFGNRTFQSYLSNTPDEAEGFLYTYDALQRQLTQSKDNGGTITNDYLAGNKIRVTDAEDNVTTTTYLAYGSPSYEQATKIESPENVTTDIAINIFGNITSITQSGKNGSTNISQTEYRAYDSQQRLCQIKRNDIGTIVMNRNTLGEVAWQAQGQTAASNTVCNTTAPASDKVNFTYDNLGDQRTISYGDGTPTRTFTRDNNGNIKSITGQGFSQSYNYNSLNLLEDETLTVTGRSGNMKLDYGYDSLGNLSSLQYPDGSEKINFAPNAFGQATQAIRKYADATTDVFVKGGTNKATYYANGSIDSFTYGNNIVHKTTLNNRLMPSQITDKFGTADRLNLSYTYDDNNNIRSLTNTREAGIYSLTNLTYDGLDRLTSTTGGVGIGSSTMTYDGLGNIRTYSNNSVLNPSHLTYNYKTNFLLKDVKTTGTNTKVRDFSASSSYDARGNVKSNGNSEGINTFSYNLANQMTRAGGASGNSYVYDGYNRRVKTQDSKGTSYSFYSQAGKLLYRETPQGGINYIFLGSKLIAKEGTGVVSSGDSIMNYKPFGDSIEEPKDDVGYTGHKFDTDLGLSYMQARYYDPVIGRFYSNDPVGFTGDITTFNRYSYVGNNPYTYVDPDGRTRYKFDFAAKIALGKGIGVNLSFTVDTVSNEFSLGGGGSIRTGVAAGGELSITTESSSVKGNSTYTEGNVDLTIGGGEESVKIVGQADSENGLTGDIKIESAIKIDGNGVKLNPELGISAGIGGKGEVNVSIPETRNNIAEGIKNITERICPRCQN